MISLTDFKNYLENLVSRISEIDHLVISPAESHLIKKLEKKPTGIVLVATYPSANADSPNIDNINYINTAILWVLSKPNKTAVTDDSEFSDYEETQQIIKSILDTIISDATSGCHVMRDVVPGSSQINPEYNIFGGRNGWMTPLEFRSYGN